MGQNKFFDVASVAMDFLSNFSQASLNEAINDAQKVIDNANTYSANLISNTNADAANKVRTANNGLAAAQAAFSNLQRSIGNKSKLDAAGDRLDANAQNLIRLQDATVRGGLEQSLRESEQLGAMHAQAAAAGVGGATAAMLHNTLALSAARQKTTTETNAGYQTYDMLQQRMGLMSNMVASVDAGQSFAPIDYSVSIAPLVQSPLRAGDFAPSPLSQALLSTLSKSGNLQALSDIGSMFSSEKAATPLPKPTALDMNDGWNNFSTRSFGDSTTEGLGSGFFGVGGESNGFFATGGGDSALSFRLK
jgi:hypothetical protein